MSPKRTSLIRDADAPRNLEIFIVSAIGAILLTRIYLQLTGFPQIGGEKLHIAHMLWGGLLMLAALILLVTYLNLSMRTTAAVVGGIGFGLFIDELGKFVTADNDYFFQPTFALLYVLFVGLFLLTRALVRSVPLSDYERRVNRELREEGDIAGRAAQPGPIRAYLGLIDRLHSWYATVVDLPRFRAVLVTVFVVIGLGHGATAVTTFVTQGRQAGWVDDLYLASTAVSGVFFLAGILRFRFDRVQALRLLRLGILVSLAITQVFLFYANELAAIGGLVVDLTLYTILNAMLRAEEAAKRQ